MTARPGGPKRDEQGEDQMADEQRGAGLTILIGGRVRPRAHEVDAAYDDASGVTEQQADQIRAAAPGADVRFAADRAELLDQIEAAEVIFGHVPAEALARAGRLKWVQSSAAGPNALLYPAMVASDVLVTSCKGNGAIPLAEHAMLLMLMLNRGALRWVRAQDERRWERVYHAELTGLTCGIIGLGHSGQDLAAKAKAFHMRVIGIRRGDRPTPNVDEV